MSRQNKYCQLIKLDRLKELCADLDTAKKGYGYQAMIRATGITSSCFKRVIYDGKDLSIDNLIIISEVTGCSIDWLLGLSDKKYLKD